MRWAVAVAVPVGVVLSVASAALDEHRLREHERVAVEAELAIASAALPTRLDVQLSIAQAATLLTIPEGVVDPGTWQSRMQTLAVQERSAATRSVLWVEADAGDDLGSGAVALVVPAVGPSAPTGAAETGAVVARAATFGSSVLLAGTTARVDAGDPATGHDEVGRMLASARDSGEPRLSEPFWSVQNGPAAAEAALAVPVYAEGPPPGGAPRTAQDRRAALTGWTVVTFRLDSFLGESLRHLHTGVAVGVVDQDLGGLRLADFSTGGPVQPTAGTPSHATTVEVALLDRTWVLTGASTRSQPWVSYPVLLAGLVMTTLGALVVLGQSRAEDRALATVDERTRDLSRRTRELETITSSTPDALARVSADGRLLFANRALLQSASVPPDWAGRTLDELAAHGPLLEPIRALAAEVSRDRPAGGADDVIGPAAGATGPVAAGAAETGGDPDDLPTSTVSVDVGALYYELRAVPERAPDGSVESVLVVAREMTRYRDAERRLGHAAMHDPLTGLANRVLMQEHAERMLRAPGRGVAVLLLDLDRFKLVNDSYGHNVGDELLMLAARRAERLSPHRATVGRLGGDEFVVVVPDVTPGQVEALARSVVDAFDEPFALHDEEFTMGCSLGVVHTTAWNARWDELLRCADVAMYKAKSAGRGCYRWFEEGAGDAARQRLMLAADLRRAADGDELGVAYQAEVDLRTGRAIAIEALMRWTTPARGDVPPAEFIPVAEETGLIVGLGRWIMRDAVGEVAAHNRRTGADVRMWVNVSARQLTGVDVASGVLELLDELDVPTRWLGIEVTESVLADDERVLPALVALRDAGVGVAVDDFGTGYSSFARLRDYPVTLLKIDRAFVQGLADPSPEAAERAANIVRAVIAVGRALGADVVAEGVEDQDLLRHVRALGCDHAQGYVFGRPGSFVGAVGHQPVAASGPEHEDGSAGVG
jgi:diguanylate cyclase (GGDEF)-like protein